MQKKLVPSEEVGEGGVVGLRNLSWDRAIICLTWTDKHHRDNYLSRQNTRLEKFPKTIHQRTAVREPGASSHN